MVAPTGRHQLFHPEGERATARGAAAAGALYVMRHQRHEPVEDVAKERGGAPQWFQLYMQPDREETGALLDRCVPGRLQGAGAHRRPAGAGLEPARLSHAGDPVDDVRSVNMVGQPVARTAYDPARKGVVMFPTNFARSGMAGEALRHAGGGEGRAARRRRASAASIAASRASWCRTTAAGISTPR